jgi:hypothetical protein
MTRGGSGRRGHRNPRRHGVGALVYLHGFGKLPEGLQRLWRPAAASAGIAELDLGLGSAANSVAADDMDDNVPVSL